MKKLKYIWIIAMMGLAISCSDELETNPTDQAAGTIVFQTAENAYVALNGIYRGFFKANWSSGYAAENFGIMSVNLASDCMGEDMVLNEPGSQWFWYDYKYWVRSEINNTSDRPYVWWNMFYKFINNANNIIANIDDASGEEMDKNNVKGQALAIRAFSYFYLVQLYQRTYIGHESDPGVPLYTTPATADTEGNPRGTVENVYTQINMDLDEAIGLLENASARRHISHVDINVAKGLKARVALVQNNWSDAAKYAGEAKAGLNLMAENDLTGGFSNSTATGWMWGSEINTEQATTWYSFFNHIDAAAEGHAESCRKCIASWLYDQIGEQDIRKGWFQAPLDEDASLGPNLSYNQLKFRVKTAGDWDSDYIYMRAAEMYLIEAEAQCMMGSHDKARQLLIDLLSYKDPNYETRLAGIPNGNILNIGSAGPINNLLDEIVLQRRIELWGEGARLFDIMRLKTGFDRSIAGTNHPSSLAIDDPESWEWIMMIPITEFDGNPNMDRVDDQNP